MSGFRERARERADRATERLRVLEAKGLGVEVAAGRVVNRKTRESVELAGVTATVEDAGDVERRITATRLVMTGPLALAWRKRKDHRQLFLVVDGADGAFVVEVDPKKQLEARQVAAWLTSAGRQVGV